MKKLFLFSVLITVLFFSCRTTYTPSYFNDVSLHADTVLNLSSQLKEPKIKYGDLLIINITTLDQLSDMQLYQSSPVVGNVPTSTGSIGLNIPQGTTYSVNEDDSVELPIIGKVKIGGLTLNEAKEVIRIKFAGFYKNFSINIAFANHTFTVLGEVNRPGTFNLQSTGISIYDALGYAGDITVYGKKDNVVLLRDSANNKKHLIRLDLNSKNAITSPYYYLKANDVVYVEPARSKLISTDAYRTRNTVIFTTGLSIILVIVSRLF